MTFRRTIWSYVLVLVAAATGAARGDAPGSATPQAAGKAPALRVVMWSGSAEYKSNETLPALKAHLEKQLGAACTIHEVPKSNDALPGIDDLEACDVAVIFVKRVKLPPEQLAKVKRYVDAGRPVVGLRTASHAFQTWLAFDPVVLGGDYKGHEKKDLPAAVAPAAGGNAAGHPVLAGVPAFATPGKLYRNPKLAADATVLLTADNGITKQPVAWAREHNGGRVFYTSLGVPDDFKDPAFVRLLTNAVQWAAKREPAVKP